MDYGALFTAGLAFFVAICAGTVAGLIGYTKATADAKVEIKRTVDAQIKHWHHHKAQPPRRR